MASKGTAGLGLAAAAALVLFAILNPGSPVDRTPNTGVLTGTTLTAQRVAYGAALGGQSGLADLAEIPTQEEIEQMITDLLAQATADAQAELSRILPQYLAGAQADVQAQIQGLASRFVGSGITPEQIVAALARSGGSAAPANAPSQVGNLLAPFVRDALANPSSSSSGSRPAVPQAPPAPPPTGSGGFGGDFMNRNDLNSSMDRMANELRNMGPPSMDMDLP